MSLLISFLNLLKLKRKITLLINIYIFCELELQVARAMIEDHPGENRLVQDFCHGLTPRYSRLK